MPRYTAWCDELVADLAAPFPKELHQNKGSKGTFVSVHHYVHRLNELVGPQGWSMEAPISYHSGEKLGLAVGVTILGVTKWNVGDEMEDHGEPDEDGKVRDYGSSSTNSWAQAFKRCMAYGFGCGLYMYDRQFTKDLLAGKVQRPQSQPQPVQDERPTVEQLQKITNLLAAPFFTDAEINTAKRSLEKNNTEKFAAKLIVSLTNESNKREMADANVA